MQGFCRVSAVNGSTYVLSHTTSSTSATPSASRRYSVSLDGLEESIDCDLLISSIESSCPSSPKAVTAVARCIAIIDNPLIFVIPEVENPLEGTPQSMATMVDTALVIFPPSTLPGGSETAAAHAFVTGEGSMSAPKGNCMYRSCFYWSDLIRSDKSTRDFVLVDSHG